ncbi:MAG: glycosyltransferase family 2 protein [bacterium]|nr:glycosyltransferase family 2 protein [bacterium]
MKTVFVVILNFNGGKNTIECLESLGEVSRRNFDLRIVVVDNGSSDDSVEEIRKKFENIVIIENLGNLGFTGGSNEGIRYALSGGADYILLLNNDTIVDSDLVENLFKTGFSDANIGGVVPKIYFEKGYEFHRKRYKKEDLGKVIWYAGGIMDWENLIGKNRGVDQVDHGQFGKSEETELSTGCCFLVKCQVFKKIGLFDNNYYLYYEDADLSQRIKKAGFKIVYEPKAILWHKNAESSGGSGSDLQDYYITRNRLLFGMTYAPFRTKIALFRESLSILKSGRHWQKKGVLDFYFRELGRGSFRI